MTRLVSTLTGVTLALALFYATDVISKGPEGQAGAIPRFEQVAPGLYRGGQPTPAGFEFLKWRGIRTVINLREELDEREQVEKLGFKYVYIPLDAWDPVSDQALKTFLTVVNTAAYQPVFVHCKRGSDRTGVMIGFYRMAMQGWTADRAYAEARALGMRWWHRGLERQLHDFADGRWNGP
jgi:protein tyrosine phosphatase (PTP) superfamily phosphohydrolase (DUF442 family)